MSIVRWCNTVRNFIVASANRSSRTGVILDLGSGDGKTLSSYSKEAPGTPVLFVEPNDKACESLRSVSGSSHAITEEQVAQVLGSLSGGMKNRRSLPFAVMKDKLKAEPWSDELETTLRLRCKAVVASFSVSFVTKDLVRRKKRKNVHDHCVISVRADRARKKTEVAPSKPPVNSFPVFCELNFRRRMDWYPVHILPGVMG
ncbi:hypothetical protein JB92DRAFT_1014920 [Gautieria morchelliformis]|nr:hypothetical protein JB92DRAFT_1014920 [Gautieria morchelliformis]